MTQPEIISLIEAKLSWFNQLRARGFNEVEGIITVLKGLKREIEAPPPSS